MQSFVQGIYNFIYQLMTAVRSSINLTDYNNFLSKQIIYGDLINVGLTWGELLSYVSTWFLIFLSIYLFVKFVFKLLSLFSLR